MTLCFIAFVGCQTSPIIFEIPSSGDVIPDDTDTRVCDLKDGNWQCDTADSEGGPDQPCYTRENEDEQVVWCDSPAIVAQKCDSNSVGCCCRSGCDPSMCVANNANAVPCDYFDLSTPDGYCNFPDDLFPVSYKCNGSCTTRSDCDSDADDGSCSDSDAPTDGMCLLYEMDSDVVVRCQKTCTMTFCDPTHMCVPLFSRDGTYSLKGACTPP
ncbi:MAG: hypothetical protein JXR76_18000 [Deltaproteobacteria bacterium]|nr:hypothetical protein [Deltaproteobacteria bacterium]